MNLRDNQQKAAAKKFADFWQGKGYEKGESQKFWIDLLTNVYGVENISEFISFEDQVHLDHTSFIDGFIPYTKVLIEQKGSNKDLRKPIKQSDGSFLTPFQQAKRYVTELPVSKHPRWIVTCNFKEFNVYDMESPWGEPEIILLENLPNEYYRLSFLVETGKEHLRKEEQISVDAGNAVGLLYDALLKQYKTVDEDVLKSLNKLCVRLVFCLYAEDAGIFGKHGMFYDYLQRFEARDMRRAIIDLFKVLDQREEERDEYLDQDLKDFPYVNGGLFADENIVVPQFTDDIKNILLEKASLDIDWSGISPTIFGAVFESTLSAKVRRSGGMHYTSIENIHKVIDPLFLNDLRAELTAIEQIGVKKTREAKLQEFTDKLAGLTFFDPACGSGNFLTETFLSLRRLENEALSVIFGDQIVFDTGELIKVSINQFYGIEINDFAVTVAKTALWIAEHQMIQETQKIVHRDIDFLPLTSYTNITEGNALRIDWRDVVAPEKLSYIMGNPPFVGYSLQTKEQKADMLSIYVDEKDKPYKTAGKVDYVSGWYFKASAYIQGTNIRCAFVSTNSITQGEQVAAVWKPLYDRFGIHIDFAWRTFKWGSESNDAAAVHCVIVGFSSAENKNKRKLFLSSQVVHEVDNINAYLIEADNIFIEAQSKPICDVPILMNGGKPTEGGNLILTEEEKDDLLKKEPQAVSLIRPYMMGKDFIQRKPRYCLWLVNASPSELRKCPAIMERIEKVRQYRLESPKEATKKKAETPMLFDEVRECFSDYVAIPKVSSENRKYIPIDYLSKDIIAGDKLFMIQNATLYDFGVLTSNVHMAWMRAVAGRLKSDYSYSNTIVYNNFPWCVPTDEQKAAIEKTAQGILDARAQYPNDSLADLYDEAVMPQSLRKAHQANDTAVMKAYGLSTKGDVTESSCVAFLFEKYREITEGK